jgi:preprotein translocase subunit SecF
MRVLKNVHFDFIKYARPVLIIASVYVTIIVVLLLTRGLNYGLDFTGGTLIQVLFEKPVTTNDIRQALSNYNLQNSIIQPAERPNDFIIRVPLQITTEQATQQINQALLSIPNNSFETLRTEQVGPKIGKELRGSMFKAILSALVVILVYISFRFQFKFGVGAVVALVHDVLFTLGFFSLFQLEISLSTIAAFLTIVGYSLNDTIVVFDRVRENMHTRRYPNIIDLFNHSINETLSRTVITSLTTILVVFVLVFAHGEIQIFSIALIVGIMVGTFSSIYIAPPLVIYWQKQALLPTKK